MKKLLVGMSGGVDSSLSAALLLEQGYEIAGATLSLFENASAADIADARRVCEALGISHRTLFFGEEFSRLVTDNFISEYLAGRTPNPCVVCNRTVKFGKMLDTALENGFDGVATGHYAALEVQNGRTLLKRAADPSKDQSYMLYSLNQHQLSHACFPLGQLTKGEVRALAQERQLSVSQKKDSQDICFIPDGDYAGYIERAIGRAVPAGDFCDVNGKLLGRHAGIIRYTEGQRKGLGIALGKPQFVLSKSAEDNRVVLGDEAGLFFKRVLVENVNYIPFDGLSSPLRVQAKLRYRHAPQAAVLHPTEKGALLEFEEPQRAPTAGQSAVFYDGDIVIGGGIIEGGIK